MKTLGLNLFIFLTFSAASQSVISIGSTTVIADTVYTGLDVPWEILYGSDDHLWITERRGVVSRIDPVLKTKSVILDKSASVFTYGESGMLGMAFHPDFPAVPEIFLVYNYGILQDIKERLVKYTYSNGQLVNEQILINDIKGNVGHDGSRLLFLPDKTLLMSMGEAHDGSLSQNLNSLNGKILRLKTDGSIPSDNPFPGSYVYSSGHRNPQGLSVGPHGIVYISDHGATSDDEFQILEKGRNYGWPTVEGYCDQPAEMSFCLANNVKEPMLDWTPTLAVGDLLWYSNSAFPELDERMLVATLKAKTLVAIKMNSAGTVSISESWYLTEMFGRLRALCAGPSKEIYIATNGANPANVDPNTHSILVLRPPVPPLSIKDSPADPNISVYPTFCNDQITVETNLYEGTIEIFDLFGNKIHHTIFSKTILLDARALKPGMYLVMVYKNGKRIHHQKMIRE